MSIILYGCPMLYLISSGNLPYSFVHPVFNAMSCLGFSSMFSAVLTHDRIFWKPKYIILINFTTSTMFIVESFKSFVHSPSETGYLQIVIAALCVFATVFTTVLTYRWFMYLIYKVILKPDDYYCSIYVIMVLTYFVSTWTLFIVYRNYQIYELKSDYFLSRLWLNVSILVLAMTIHKEIESEKHQQSKVMV